MGEILGNVPGMGEICVEGGCSSLHPGNGLGSEWHSVYPILVGNSGVHGHVSASLDNPPILLF